MIGQQLGNYRVVRQIGQGGMGTVYEAVHTQMRRRAAIKVLHPAYSDNPDIVRRFFNEALAVSVVNHPGLVGVFESGQLEDGSAFLIMEYLEGESLRHRLLAGPMAQREVLSIGRQVAAALTAAHEKGIIHRDLKADNVMLVPDPEVPEKQRVKILDFGIAKVAAEHQVNAIHTKDGVVMGTPECMPPEQWMSATLVDDKSDVYALGVLLFEMLAGHHPFTGDSPQQWMMQHLYEPVPVAPGPPALRSLVACMLDKTRAGRPAMAQVTAEIEEIVDSGEAEGEAAPGPVALRESFQATEENLSPAFFRPLPASPSDPTVMARVVSPAADDLTVPLEKGSIPTLGMMPGLVQPAPAGVPAPTLKASAVPAQRRLPGPLPLWRLGLFMLLGAVIAGLLLLR